MTPLFVSVIQNLISMEQEIWKDIPGYEGLYQVSNLGKVKRLPIGKQWPYRQTHNNIRKQRLSTSGYLRVNLSKNNKVKWYNVHRLVALAFIPNPDNLPIINHKDENKTNNCVENLEWCTTIYNVNYGTARERQKETRRNNPNDKIVRQKVGEGNGKRVRQYTPDGVFIAEYASAMEASRATGVHDSQIRRHCKGQVGNDMNRTIRKFRFEYVI